MAEPEKIQSIQQESSEIHIHAQPEDSKHTNPTQETMSLPSTSMDIEDGGNKAVSQFRQSQAPNTMFGGHNKGTFNYQCQIINQPVAQCSGGRHDNKREEEKSNNTNITQAMTNLTKQVQQIGLHVTKKADDIENGIKQVAKSTEQCSKDNKEVKEKLETIENTTHDLRDEAGQNAETIKKIKESQKNTEECLMYSAARERLMKKDIKATKVETEQMSNKVDVLVENTSENFKGIVENIDKIGKKTDMIQENGIVLDGKVSEMKEALNDVKKGVDETSVHVQNNTARIDDATNLIQDATLQMRQAADTVSAAATKVEQNSDKIEENIATQNQKMDAMVQTIHPSPESLKQEQFKKNAELLMEYVKTDRLLPHLFSELKISLHQMQKIKKGETTHDKVLRLLLIIDELPDGVEVFNQALVDTEQGILARQVFG